ncbi:hypothetical protein Tco_0026688 [Tanacetum coccineum]
MVEKCIVKIKGTFLEKIHNDAFNGNKGENAYEHINKFLDVVGPIKINGLTQDRFWLSIFPVSLTGVAYEWFTKEYLNTYNEYEQELNNDEAKGTNEPWELLGMVRVGSMTYFQDHRWYDELADGKLKDETLALKSKIEGSWGEATPEVLKFCKWLKSCFKNFHEIEYEVLDLAETMIWYMLKKIYVELIRHSEAIVNTLSAQELIMENYYKQNIREFSVLIFSLII